MMSFYGWTHPYYGKGRRRSYDELPKTVADIEDDPYRSLARELRKTGGFAKDSTPFAEFLSADFFRPRIKAKTIKANFDAALADAMALAKTADADYLPGWCAPHPESSGRRIGFRGENRPEVRKDRKEAIAPLGIRGERPAPAWQKRG